MEKLVQPLFKLLLALLALIFNMLLLGLKLHLALGILLDLRMQTLHRGL